MVMMDSMLAGCVSSALSRYLDDRGRGICRRASWSSERSCSPSVMTSTQPRTSLTCTGWLCWRPSSTRIEVSSTRQVRHAKPASPEICRTINDQAKWRLRGAVCPGIRSTWSRSASDAPADHVAATPGHPRGRVSAEREPLSRSRACSRNTMEPDTPLEHGGLGRVEADLVRADRGPRPRRAACSHGDRLPGLDLEPASPLVSCSSHRHAKHSSPRRTRRAAKVRTRPDGGRRWGSSGARWRRGQPPEFC